MSNQNDSTLDLEGATLSYEVHDGAGPTVVALHGLSSSRANDDAGGYFDWSGVARAGRRLVRYDARGHGKSTGRPIATDYLWPALADDLLALLDVVSPDAPVDGIGISMGVGTLLHAATRHPERFRRLAFVIPPTAWETRAAQGVVYKQMADLVETQGKDALVRLMATLPALPILEAGGWPRGSGPDIAELLAPEVFRGAAASDFPDPDSVSSVKQSVLLAPWVDDPGHPVSTGELLHDLLPDSDLRVTRTPDDLRSLGDAVTRFLTEG